MSKRNIKLKSKRSQSVKVSHSKQLLQEVSGINGGYENIK